MAADSSASKNPSAGDNRVRDFLQKSEEFIHTYGTRDPALMPQLAMYAQKYGLTKDEFEMACSELHIVTPPALPNQRPVTIPVPPPLPSNNLPPATDAPGPRAPVIKITDADVLRLTDDDVIEEEAALVEAVSVPSPPPVPLSTPSSVASTKSSPPSLPAATVKKQAVFDQKPVDVKPRFMQQAKLILGHTHGWSPQALAMIYQHASELGITDERRDLWINELRGPDPDARVKPARSLPEKSETASPEKQAAKKEQSKAEATPAPKKKRERKPLSAQDTFRIYLKKAFKALSTHNINPVREAKLIQEGVTKLGLSEILASDLLHEVAKKMDRTVLSLHQETKEDDIEEEQEERITDFQQRAASIIAGQGGVNSISRAMIATVAKDLGLSAEQGEAALTLIQKESEKTGEENKNIQRSEAFRAFILDKLQHIKHGIVSAKVARQLTDIGVDLHGLDHSVAELTLRNAVADEDLQLISHKQAASHLGKIIASIFEDEDDISAENRKRIIAEGDQWGLTLVEINEVIAHQNELQAKRVKQDQRRSSRVLFVCFSIILVGLLYLGYYLKLENNPIEPGPNINTIVTDVPDDDPNQLQPEVAKWGRQPWWDEGLTLDMVQLYQNHQEISEYLEAICVADENQRTAAYKRLTARLLSDVIEDKSGSNYDKFSQILQKLYHADPSDVAASQILNSLLKSVPDDTVMPTSVPLFERQFMALDMAASLADPSNIDPNRTNQVIGSLEAKLNIALADPTHLRESSLKEFSRNQYRHLSTRADKNVAEVARLHLAMSDAIKNRLDSADVDAMDINLVMDVLPQLSSNWDAYKPVVQRLIDSGNTSGLLQLIDLYEVGLDNNSIQSELGVMLSRFMQVNIDGLPSDQSATLMRNSQGASSLTRGAQERWRYFWNQADPVTLIDDERLSPTELLEETLLLSYIGTLGHAVAKKDLGTQSFERLTGDGRPSLEEQDPAAPAAATNQASFSIADPRTSDLIRSLVRNSSPQLRMTILNSLTSLAPSIEDLEYGEAVQLVAYLFRLKPRNEHDLVIRSIPAFSHWGTLKLAIADKMPSARRNVDDLQSIVGALLGRTIVLPTKSKLNLQLQRILLQDALANIEVEAGQVGALSPLDADRAAELLLDMYGEQAIMAGVPQAVRQAATLPSELLLAIIQIRIQALSASSNDSIKERLQLIEHELRVVNYLASNDISTTAAYQRIWLKVLLIEVEQTKPKQTIQAAGLMLRLAMNDRKSKNIFLQLRNGEAALVKMWQLLAQP
ncbi:MAG: hypothetical protein COA78_10140 [Blastopirellula sp.]|nr:MAG: hypothetical protein COA78_10140 [Blastopirellula sp.]